MPVHPASQFLGLNLCGGLHHGRFGGPKWLIPVSNVLPPMERNRRLLLDRYESHTKNCKVATS